MILDGDAIMMMIWSLALMHFPGVRIAVRRWCMKLSCLRSYAMRIAASQMFIYLIVR